MKARSGDELRHLPTALEWRCRVVSVVNNQGRHLDASEQPARIVRGTRLGYAHGRVCRSGNTLQFCETFGGYR
jgi:hypothetical protein